MNIKALTLSIISVAAAVAASTPAQAQEAGEAPRPNARWSFAPNVWKKETIQMPRGYNAPAPMAAVRSGAVPGKSMLGLDPSYLAKAPAPMPAPLVRVNQAVSAVPIAVKPASPLEAFQKAFGKPVSATPAALVASAPQAMSAVPASTSPSASRQVSAHRIPSVRHSSNLNGKVLTPQHRTGLAARPAAPIQSYGSSFFSPVPFNPASAGSGSSTSATVSGRIYHGR